MLIFAGLGNPGKKYANNRHNLGFMVIDNIAKTYGFPNWQSKSNALICKGKVNNHDIVLVKPQTFMNSSGQPIANIAKFFKIPVHDIFVFHDEVEIDPGKIKIKQGGGHAGHNGLKNIDKHCGNDYWRIRLGVGRHHTDCSLYDYVLADFTAQELDTWANTLVTDASNNAEHIASRDKNKFFNAIQTSTQCKHN